MQWESPHRHRPPIAKRWQTVAGWSSRRDPRDIRGKTLCIPAGMPERWLRSRFLICALKLKSFSRRNVNRPDQAFFRGAGSGIGTLRNRVIVA